jgi:hypothetical protein
MNITRALSGSRGTSNLISRMGTILDRFGITAGKFEDCLESYSALTTRAGCVATLPITAVILKRHPELIRRFNQKGLEFAIHGYVHIDYQQLTADAQIEHFKKAINTFDSCQVPYTGFRAPYLRYNSSTPYALSSLNFLYDSSTSIYWNVMGKGNFSHSAWNEYLRVLDYYRSHNCLDFPALPRYSGDGRLIEIPVSLPDDEAMVERLGIRDEPGITGIWSSILQETYRRGELFSLQLHPERVFICGNSLRQVIEQARKNQPPVWIATLGEIAKWWKEKDAFSFDIQPDGSGRYRVKALCSERATILVKNCQVSCLTREWSDGYQCLDPREFIVDSAKPPVIGIGLNSSPDAVRFLRSEGYPVEANPKEENYGTYFPNLDRFQTADERRLLEDINSTDGPQVRFGRWPNRTKSALSVSGDIDSITLFDFGLRLLEARRLRNGQKYHVEAVSVGAPV